MSQRWYVYQANVWHDETWHCGGHRTALAAFFHSMISDISHPEFYQWVEVR